MKRVFIVHGWGGRPDESWFPWIQRELESKGFKTTSLEESFSLIWD